MSQRRNNEPKKNEKEKKHTGRNVTIGVILALLLSGGGYFGLGPGQGMLQDGLGLVTGQNQSAETQESGETSQLPSNSEESGIQESNTQDSAFLGDSESSREDKETSEENVVGITVKESAILVNGQEMDAQKLEEYLTTTFISGEDAAENLKNLSIVVKDDHAIKATYDEVIALLTRLDLSYSEEQ